MRGTRAIGLIGLVVGLSGCAGTHHHHQPAGKPSGLLGGSPGMAGTSCACAVPVPAGSPVPTVASRPGTVVATTGRRPSPGLMLRRNASEGSRPLSSRPVPVPAPGASAPGVVRYFPLSDEGSAGLRSAWESAPPDLLGVRTSMAPAASPDRSDAPTRPEEGAWPPLQPLTSTARPRSMVPSWLRDGKTRRAEVSREVVPVSAEVVMPARPPGLASPSPADLAPPMAGPLLETGTPGSRPGKTLNLEYTDQDVLQGRPRWDPKTGVSAVDHDIKAPTTWVSALAFSRGAGKPAAPTADGRIVPTSREVARPAGATGAPSAVVARFLKRVRGARRAFLDPDSVRGEPGDLPKWGEGVERASAHRLDEPPKR